MDFEKYIRSNYLSACRLQQDDVEKGDKKMQLMLASGIQDVSIVKEWMRNYGLFQGITTGNRDKIAKRFLSFVKTATPAENVADQKVLQEKYAELFGQLFY